MKPIITYRRLITPLALLLLASAPAYSMTWGRSVDRSARSATTATGGGGGGGCAAAAPDESAKIVAAVSSAIATPSDLSASTALKRSYAEAAKSGLLPATAALYAAHATSSASEHSIATTTPAAASAGPVVATGTKGTTASAIPVAATADAPATSATGSAATKSAADSSPAMPALACGLTAQPGVLSKLLSYVWATDPVTQMQAGTLTPDQVRIHDIENRLDASIKANDTTAVMTIIDWLDQHPKFVVNRTFTEQATNYLASSKALEVSSVTKALSLVEVEIIEKANAVMASCAATVQAHSDQAHRIKQAQTKARRLAKASGAPAETVGDDATYSDDEAYARPHEMPARVQPAALLAQTFTNARHRYTFPSSD